MAEKMLSQISGLNPKKPDTGLRKAICDKCGKPMVTIGEWKPGHFHICNKCMEKGKKR